MKHVLLVMFVCTCALGQPRVSYEMSFGNAVHHEAVVTATFTGLPAGPFQLRMSRTSPGRYALHEYAKNVYAVRITGKDGKELPVRRPNPYQWDVAQHTGSITVTYTIFGDHADGTYVGIDETHAHINMPSTFMFGRGLDDAPIAITFKVPEKSGWRVATQLMPTDDPYVFTAPGLQYFMDSPTELSAYTLREWTVPAADGGYRFRLVLHHQGTDAEADVYAEMAKRLVVEAMGVFGEFPSYENGTYTFLADYLPYVYGDGMEHRNSTLLLSSSSLRKGAIYQLSTLAHEFFHSWNVERIRPATLEPFNFEEANMSAELWFAEGVTSYYDNLLMARASMKSTEAFASSMGSVIDQVVNLPGRKFYSAAQMSMKAPFRDAATSVDEQNTVNTFISYYTWGEAIGIGLDLELRTRFPGRDLDGFMRLVWQKYGKTERPYANEDLKNTLAEYIGDAAFAGSFFQKHVLGHDVVDYGALLGKAGFLLRKSREGKAGLGRVHMDYENEHAVVSSETMIGSPLYKAGIDRRDTVVSIDGTPLTSPKEYDDILGRHKPDDIVEIIFVQRGVRKTVSVSLEEKDFLEVVTYESTGKVVTPEMLKVREEWLASKAGKRYPPLARTCPTCRRSFAFPMQYCSFDGERLPLTAEK